MSPHLSAAFAELVTASVAAGIHGAEQWNLERHRDGSVWIRWAAFPAHVMGGIPRAKGGRHGSRSRWAASRRLPMGGIGLGVDGRHSGGRHGCGAARVAGDTATAIETLRTHKEWMTR